MNEEQAWIIQAKNGSDEAFTHLVETFQTPVFNLCYRMLGEPEAAEDAAQETFFKAYRNLGKYDQERSFPTWLLSIAAHHCIDKLRRQKYPLISIDDEENFFEIPDKTTPDPEAEVERREEQYQMQLILNTLDAIDRAAIIMRYWNDCSEVEISQALAITVPAVKSRLHRARKALAKQWELKSAQAEPKRRHRESPAF